MNILFLFLLLVICDFFLLEWNLLFFILDWWMCYVILENTIGSCPVWSARSCGTIGMFVTRVRFYFILQFLCLYNRIFRELVDTCTSGMHFAA